MSTINAFFAVGFLVFILGAIVMYGKQHGFTMEKMSSALAGGFFLYFVIMLGFWFGAQLGWWSLGYSASHVSVDDQFKDSFSSIVSGGMLKTDGMGDIDLSDNSYTTDVTDANPDGSSASPVEAIDPYAAVVEVIRSTPTPMPTPVKYRQNVEKPVTAWAKWFVDNSYNREAVNLDNIPAGVRCRVIKTGKKGWFSGQNVWTARCADPSNPDYGKADIQLTERAYISLGIKSDDAVIIGTGKWPKDYFVLEDDQQSLAPASAPGSVAPGSGPDTMTNVFSGWLIVDAVDGIRCDWSGSNKILPMGSRHRFDPRSIRDNTPNKVPQVEVLMTSGGATCWAQIWPGKSHFE